MSSVLSQTRKWTRKDQKRKSIGDFTVKESPIGTDGLGFVSESVN